VRLFWKSLISLLVVLLLFEGMVTAFHLLNLPSNRAVGGVVVFRNIWKRRV
jgi:hypothetical protein